jgi:hypothetical protein
VAGGQICRTDDGSKLVHAPSCARYALYILVQLAHVSVRLARCIARNRGSTCRVAQRERQAALPDDRGAIFPATDDSIHQPVHVVGEHLTSAERQVIQAVRRKRAAADGLIVADNGLLIPRSEAARSICTTLVRVVQVEAEPLRKLLSKFGLQGVVVGVLVVPVVADILGPVTRAESAGGKMTVIVTSEQRLVGSAAIDDP